MWKRTATAPTMTSAELIAALEGCGIAPDDAQRAACDTLVGADSVYLVGPAGRGKTAILNAFVTCSPARSVVRTHWHDFLRDLHVLIRSSGGLAPALERFLGSAGILAFDELHVDDPADGIFLHGLIDHLTKRGVRLVVTSNDRPDDLMPNPLFHDSFLPTIDLIKTTCTVIDLDSGIDYRTRADHCTGFSTGSWRPPAPVPDGSARPVAVAGRQFTAWDAAGEHLGVAFDEICGRPLGATDYLDLARRFRRWTISDVPDLVDTDREAAQRLVHLVDVLYDRDVPTTITSAVPRDRFARTGRLPAGAPRMRSRLTALRDDDLTTG